jgi:hypothetical protein
MKKAPLKKVFEKAGDIFIDLGKASILAGFALIFLEKSRWIEGIIGIVFGIILIAGGLVTAFYAEKIGEDEENE